MTCSAPPLTSHFDQNTEAEDDKNLEELGFVPSAVAEARWAQRKCDKRCRARVFKFFENCGCCDGRRAVQRIR